MPKAKRQTAALLKAREAKQKKRNEDENRTRERFELQQKQDQHKCSMTFTSTKKIQNIINHFQCPKCKTTGSQLVNQLVIRF